MKKVGFTIIEVLLAIVLLSTALLMLSPMQMGSLRRIMRQGGDLQRIYLLREKLQTLLTTPPKTLKGAAEKREKPPTEIKTSFHDITKKSSLSQFSQDIVIARVDGIHDDRTQTLITFVPRPAKEQS